MKRVLDLCSGLGGFSEAFMDSDEYHVIRIENNPLLADVPGTFQLDVLEWADWIQGIPSVDILLMSPPCLEFSQGYNAPRCKAFREGEEYEPNMDLVEACLDIKDHLKPDFWILENVVGATTWFKDNSRLGKWKQKIGPFCLWGQFPYLATNFKPRSGKTQDWNIGDPLRANKRALIPFEISLEIRNTYEQQRTLEAFE